MTAGISYRTTVTPLVVVDVVTPVDAGEVAWDRVLALVAGGERLREGDRLLFPDRATRRFLAGVAAAVVSVPVRPGDDTACVAVVRDAVEDVEYRICFLDEQHCLSVSLFLRPAERPVAAASLVFVSLPRPSWAMFSGGERLEGVFACYTDAGLVAESGDALFPFLLRESPEWDDRALGSQARAVSRALEGLSSADPLAVGALLGWYVRRRGRGLLVLSLDRTVRRR